MQQHNFWFSHQSDAITSYLNIKYQNLEQNIHENYISQIDNNERNSNEKTDHLEIQNEKMKGDRQIIPV
jgi:hypothetical protein